MLSCCFLFFTFLISLALFNWKRSKFGSFKALICEWVLNYSKNQKGYLKDKHADNLKSLKKKWDIGLISCLFNILSLSASGVYRELCLQVIKHKHECELQGARQHLEVITHTHTHSTYCVKPLFNNTLRQCCWTNVYVCHRVSGRCCLMPWSQNCWRR